MRKYKLSDFDYHLPKEMIAQYPETKRENSKLMILNRNKKEIFIDKFYNIANYLESSDMLVVNETKVIPARLIGKKLTGGKVEFLLLEQIDEHHWKCLVKPARRLKIGSTATFGNGLLTSEIIKYLNGERIVKFIFDGDFFSILNKIGKVPLPPYIKRDDTELDKKRYQTVFAKEMGSVAAPTAGLHFSKNLLEKIQNKNIKTVSVNLKIGLDTFRPVKTPNIENHKMHKEFCSVSDLVAEEINLHRKNFGKIVAVGTTSVRTLESFFQNKKLNSGQKWTELFIYSKYKFGIVDKLITNFHLPKSSLLMLVSAFAGHDLIKTAYQKAIEENFRFYSYGDAMLII